MTTNPSIPFNFIPEEPSLTDALNLLKRDVFLNLNCHHIGTIESFDATKQTAKVSINYPKTYFQLDEESGLYSPVQVEYPLLADCPVIFLGGGAGCLTFPVSVGDECLVLFNDRDIGNWYQGGPGAPVPTPRCHSVSDGIILVGVRSLGNVLSGFDTSNVVLKNGSSSVKLGSNAAMTNGTTTVQCGSVVTIENNSTTLNTLLQSLITDINTLITQVAAITVTGVTTGPGVSGVPVNAAAITAVSSSLSSLATQIGDLLG